MIRPGKETPMISAHSDMTIRDIRVTMLRLPWADDPWLKGAALGATRDILICDVETSGGVTGMGYLFVFKPAMKSIAACLEECIIPRVIGKDATAIEAIWRDLWTATMTYGRGGIAAMAMSALDIALWDAVGKRAGLPLHRLWGHYRSEIPIYGSGCFRGAGGDGMIEKALHFVKQGYKAIKMQVAHVHTPAQDLDNVRRMREALGPDIDIMIDVNMGWSADVAIEMGRKFEKYDIYWLEEPVPADDFAGYQRIAAALDMRVVGGETHFTRYDLRPFFLNPCLPILQPDPMRGGMTDLRKIAALADTFGITIAPHLFPELNVHLLASIPNGIWCENMALIDDLWVDPPEIANGMITAPERPGHGLRFREDVLKFKIWLERFADRRFDGLETTSQRWRATMSVVRTDIEPQTIVFRDDGLVPNNPMPFLVYKAAVDVSKNPEATIEQLFGENGWGAMWRNGVYDFAHYHATVHEVLGVARGRARVQFGGERGQALEIAAGDVAILPAGTGHQCLSASDDFCVVGAYPPGPPMDLQRPTPENHARALKTIPQVTIPATDPVLGKDGPLVRLWKR
ncbi:hypothetical protein E3H11_02600 [Bradyrhizobium brasilense]|nr:hypothetical protein [Bradyrhizobium brasilense]